MAESLQEALEQMPLTSVHIGDLVIELVERKVTVGNRAVRLSPVEYRMLARLARAKGGIVSEDELLEYALGLGGVRSKEYVKVYISKLRKKLAVASAGRKYIETVWRKGYALMPPT